MKSIIDPKERAVAAASWPWPKRCSFWTGLIAVTVGIAVQLPMYFDARADHYRLAGMAIPSSMYTGMLLIVFGTAAAAWERGRLAGRARGIRLGFVLMPWIPRA